MPRLRLVTHFMQAMFTGAEAVAWYTLMVKSVEEVVETLIMVRLVRSVYGFIASLGYIIRWHDVCCNLEVARLAKM